MKQRLLLLATLCIICGTLINAPPDAVGGELPAGEVTKDLERTLELWRDGNYGELYGRVTHSGGQTREHFSSLLAAAPRRPSCCWDKLQEVRVTFKDQRRALLHGRFGLDAGVGVEFMTRGVKLEKDDGIWKMKMSDLLSLSGKGKKVRGGKKKAK
jgi:hypothetical protein